MELPADFSGENTEVGENLSVAIYEEVWTEVEK